MRRRKLSRRLRRRVKALNRVIRKGRRARRVKRAVLSRGGILF